ncbi:hypothetical protein PoB_004334300 [Plakobranchus ocellatus]|uniref:Uncharacterized protein n=1 Tax=Plakobranchus ocellatus TaxID=259542 RepID=A0AAV4BB97_9GAST|nr:hypothetical protein PoB_004334300 [Plakobranchus ocellatus]
MLKIDNYNVDDNHDDFYDDNSHSGDDDDNEEEKKEEEEGEEEEEEDDDDDEDNDNVDEGDIDHYLLSFLTMIFEAVILMDGDLCDRHDCVHIILSCHYLIKTFFFFFFAFRNLNVTV